MNYTGLNDYEVLYMIKEHDELAYNAMYQKYYPLIEKLAKNYFISYKNDGVDFDELYQEGLVALNNAIREFKENFNCLFYSYVIICIKRQMQRLIKDKMRFKHQVLTKAISLEQDISSTELKLEEIIGDLDFNLYKDLEGKVVSKNILDLKYQLNGNQALVYELKLNNFTNKEIAILLDVSYKTVDKLLIAIKEKLKNYVNENRENMLYLL